MSGRKQKSQETKNSVVLSKNGIPVLDSYSDGKLKRALKWTPEERFQKWGHRSKPSGDEFVDWAMHTREEDRDKQLDNELRTLFMEDLKNGV
jgi:hypothetical protein